MYRLNYFFGVLMFSTFAVLPCFSQSSFFTPSDTLHNKRRNIVYASYGTAYTLSYIGLYHLWYKQNGMSNFKFHNDNKHWLQMDKIGHFTTAYQMGEDAINVLRWAGVSNKKAIWQGGVSGLLYLTGVEILDGFSNDYGFSWGDQTANALGSMFVIGQELMWNEQRLRLKFSYFPSKYAQYRPELLGKNWIESWLKDYNGQTYWLSLSPGSFGQQNSFPKWLCLSFGYSANGMTGSYINPTFNNAGEPIPDFTRYRQYFFSLDLDLTKLKPKSPFLKMLFSTFGYIKFPFSALEYNQMDGFVFRSIYF
ncbi:MAG: YfiM family protein [Oceanicaulis sp.]|nr:YfiM family protein [Oceanicaulis sp.]